jgi:TatD DNase family protein
MLIDAHAHIDRYDLVGPEALPSALGEIWRHRIFTISNSMDLPSYQRNLEIAADCEFILPIFGVHPWNAPDYAGRLDDLVPAIEQSPMLGEIGLDHHFVEDGTQYPAQRAVLEFFLAAARDQGKIVNLHTKGAEEEVLRLLDGYGVDRAIVHWYSGPLDVFHDLVARGLYFTLGIEVRHSDHLRAIARQVPSGQLLTETDNPGGPRGFIGRPGTPGLIEDVVRALAAVRGVSPEAIVETVQANLWTLIEHDPSLARPYARLWGERPNAS